MGWGGETEAKLKKKIQEIQENKTFNELENIIWLPGEHRPIKSQMYLNYVYVI